MCLRLREEHEGQAGLHGAACGEWDQLSWSSYLVSYRGPVTGIRTSCHGPVTGIGTTCHGPVTGIGTSCHGEVKVGLVSLT